MDLKEDEIKEVTKLGSLNGGEVKLVTLKGGLHMGIGKKTDDSNQSTILAVGSHPALVSYQISKKYEQKFEQNLTKNESEKNPEVIDYSKNLSKLNKNILGIDIYVLKKDNEINFQITKHNFEIFSIQATEKNDVLSLEKTFKDDQKLSKLDKKELSKSLEKTIKEFAKNNKLKIEKKF